MMKSLLTFAKAASVILLHADPGSSQVPDRVYPFTELSDEDVARLDLRDGTVFDWLDIVGEPSLTALDFHTNPQYSELRSFLLRLSASGSPGMTPPITCTWRCSRPMTST